MKLRLHRTGLALVLFFARGAYVCALDAPALPELKPPQTAAPGLNLTITSALAGAKPDSQPVRLAALFVPANQPPSAFVPAGAFRAKFEGSIQSPLRAEYAFGADLAGTLK